MSPRRSSGPMPASALCSRGVACATVLTPGFRIVLRDAFGGLHRVHASSDGVMRWAGEAVVIGKVVSVEGAAIVLGDVEGRPRDTGRRSGRR